MDTTYARTEPGARAAFELAKYYETSAGDYWKAREYYTRATTVPTIPSFAEANRKITSFTLYFSFKKELAVADSISLLAVRTDSAVSPAPLSAQAQGDSARRADSLRVAAQSARELLMADSLNNTEERAGAGLGELFYTDLANPDSAFYWLKFALRHKYDASTAPRILYILAELAGTYPDKTSVLAKEYENQLVKDFPDSYFAKQSQNIAPDQLAKDRSMIDSENAYRAAESLLEEGKDSLAVVAFSQVVRHYPVSGVAAKSQYAIGWLYENRLAKMDSAAVKYKILIAQYPTSPYARAVSGKILDTLASVAAPIDTVARRAQLPTQKADSVRVQQANNPAGGPKPGAPLSRRARIQQSMNQNKIENR